MFCFLQIIKCRQNNVLIFWPRQMISYTVDWFCETKKTQHSVSLWGWFEWCKQQRWRDILVVCLAQKVNRNCLKPTVFTPGFIVGKNEKKKNERSGKDHWTAEKITGRLEKERREWTSPCQNSHCVYISQRCWDTISNYQNVLMIT